MVVGLVVVPVLSVALLSIWCRDFEAPESKYVLMEHSVLIESGEESMPQVRLVVSLILVVGETQTVAER